MDGTINRSGESHAETPQYKCKIHRNHSLATEYPNKVTTRMGGCMDGIFRKHADGKLIKTHQEIKAIIINERLRADRNHHGFSLLILEIRSQDGNPPANLNANLPLERIRSSDYIGHFHKNRIVLVLPYTKRAEAERLALDLTRLVGGKNLRISHKVHTYPDDLDAIEAELADELSDKPDIASGGLQCSPADEHIMDIINNPIPAWKKALDKSAAGTMVLVLAPIFISISLLIKILSPGPVLYSQMRVGYKGRQFRMWKFRTMKHDSSDGVHKEYLKSLISSETPMIKLDSAKDSRIIPGGRILRATGLDELPQLFNVLKGEMSLVGPRPSLPYETEQFQRWQHRRFDVLPGLTGLWQVSGKNRTTFLEMIKLDLSYVRWQSPTLDAMICAKTVPVVFGQMRDHFRNAKGGKAHS